ncbi:MAG: sulfur carrier protein ThiS [Peptococcaceae bacterium]|jgi:sulfur carrier protein|nr:sulfur carrier protein ThiS [Peptococcaceae bacterium]
MNITVTGSTKEYPQGLTVAQLIQLEKVATPEYVTVSINDEFILSATFAEKTLNEGDHVEFMYFMGGGR